VSPTHSIRDQHFHGKVHTVGADAPGKWRTMPQAGILPAEYQHSPQPGGDEVSAVTSGQPAQQRTVPHQDRDRRWRNRHTSSYESPAQLPKRSPTSSSRIGSTVLTLCATMGGCDLERLQHRCQLLIRRQRLRKMTSQTWLRRHDGSAQAILGAGDRRSFQDTPIGRVVPSIHVGRRPGCAKSPQIRRKVTVEGSLKEMGCRMFIQILRRSTCAPDGTLPGPELAE